MCLTGGNSRCRDHSANTEGYTYLQERLHNTQSSMCSPLGSCIKPFPSLKKKMAAYIEEMAEPSPHPFNQSFPNRPNPSLFTKLPKAMLQKERGL